MKNLHIPIIFILQVFLLGLTVVVGLVLIIVFAARTLGII